MSPASRRYVPERSGPLIRSRRDEDEEVLDEVFGPSDPHGPSAFDIALIVVGVGVLIWGLSKGSGTVDFFGAAVIVLGLVLPLRALARRSPFAMRSPGLPLDGDDPLVARLITAYDVIFTGHDAARLMVQPVTHLAAVEVASLLEGQPPGGPAQRAYVIERVQQLESLARQLHDERGSLFRAVNTAVGGDAREAQALGRLELESATTSSLDALRRFTGDDSNDRPT